MCAWSKIPGWQQILGVLKFPKRLLRGAEGHIIVLSNLYLFTSFYVSGPGDQLLELLLVKVPWVHISEDANTIKNFLNIDGFSNKVFPY